MNRHDPDAEEKFKEAAEAYEILSDAERRSVYDRYGHEGLSSSGFHSTFQGFGSFGDIFDAFFGGGDPFGSGRARQGAVQGGDVAVQAEVSLQEAARGTTVQVEYERVGRVRALQRQRRQARHADRHLRPLRRDRRAAHGRAHRVRPDRPQPGVRRLHGRGQDRAACRARSATAAAARRCARSSR